MNEQEWLQGTDLAPRINPMMKNHDPFRMFLLWLCLGPVWGLWEH